MERDDGLVTLANPDLTVVIDVLRGSDIRSLVDKRTGVDVMFRTPWAEHAAAAARRGTAMWHPDSATAWMQSYAGGWQLLCPNAGGPTTRDGVEQGFHGEAAIIPWTVEDLEADSVTLHAELFSAPLRIRRTVRLVHATVTITDVVTNTAAVPVEFDFQHHPAFGRPLVSAHSVIETGAAVFVADPTVGAADDLVGGTPLSWPPKTTDGRSLDALPAEGERVARLGWLTDFEHAWVALRNPRLDLGVCLSWDATVLPNAWLWQEFNATSSFPWFGRAHVMALEPSSTVPYGAESGDTMRLEPNGTQEVRVRLSMCGGQRTITSVDEAGVAVFAT